MGVFCVAPFYLAAKKETTRIRVTGGSGFFYLHIKGD